jgi:hypothetical protein
MRQITESSQRTEESTTQPSSISVVSDAQPFFFDHRASTLLELGPWLSFSESSIERFKHARIFKSLNKIKTKKV